mmetsp:Transcript_59327/g.108717  ORF Transcript_59327/g.108717 Transcript_59327/m.108717 type:complete len:90 (-) Transcript_59327:187-456(-)
MLRRRSQLTRKPLRQATTFSPMCQPLVACSLQQSLSLMLKLQLKLMKALKDPTYVWRAGEEELRSMSSRMGRQFLPELFDPMARMERSN